MDHTRHRQWAAWPRWRCRAIQAASLGLFVWLLGRAAGPEVNSLLPPDVFLRLDPLVALAVSALAREMLPALLPGLGVLVVTALYGRVFCGYFCPMGTTLDAFGGLARLGKKVRLASRFPRPLKYMVMVAVAGLFFFFWLSPIPLVTRIYAEVLYPLLLWLGVPALDILRPALEPLGLVSQYTTLPDRVFEARFIAAFFIFLVLMERWRPRFWCGSLCPAGALMGLFAWRPYWRRRVHHCLGCGRCVRECPTGAIGDDALQTNCKECLTCGRCQDVCPVGGVYFAGTDKASPYLLKLTADGQLDRVVSTGVSEEMEEVARAKMKLSRREFMGAAGAGVSLAMLHSLPVNRWFGGPTPVRPPGAIPEDDFLSRCLRCGECLKACPTNGLRLQVLEGGLSQLFSPTLLARRGPCEPECRACGQVCPSRAIRPLPLAEKKWAKMGTAEVLPEKCLAWAEDRRCVVCQEVCPYGAVDLVQEDGLAVPVPQVNSARCYGCGYCEYHCPVAEPAIVVTSEGALRLNGDDYQREAQARGLDLDPDRPRAEESFSDDELPPGFIL